MLAEVVQESSCQGKNTVVVTAVWLTVTACRVTVTDMSTQTEHPAWRPTDSLAHRLVLLRHELGLSQREAAIRTGVSFGVWQGMESGRATRGVDRAVAAIADTLDVDRNWLMWGGPLADPSSPVQTPRRADPTEDGNIRQYLADTSSLTLAA